MPLLAPIALTLFAAFASCRAHAQDEAYGRKPGAKSTLPTKRQAKIFKRRKKPKKPIGRKVPERKVAPTRFTKGTVLSDIAAAKKHKVIADEFQQSGEQAVDPVEVVQQQIDQELLLDNIAEEALEDMDLQLEF